MANENATQPTDRNGSGPIGHNHPSPVRRLIALLWPERRDLLVVFVFAIGVSMMALSTPVAVQVMVNFIAFGGLMQPVIILALLLFGILAFSGVVRTLQSYVVELVQRRIFVRVVADLAYRLPRVRAEAYDGSHGPELVNRFFDVLTVQKASATLLLEGLTLILSTFFGLLILAFYHPLLLVFDIALIISIALILVVLGLGATRTAIKESVTKYAVAASLEEMASNSMTFKLNGGPALALARADALAHDYITARRQHFRVLIRQFIGAFALQAIASTALLGLGGWLVIRGQLTLGQLVAAELIVAIVLTSLTKFGKHLESYYDLLAAVDKLGHLLDLPLERDGGEDYPVNGSPARLVLHNVSFAYPSGRAAVHELSFTVEPGEKVAVLGGHGSGKSTVTELIYGLRSPQVGRIELDGIDIRELSLTCLRRHLAVVKRLEIIQADVINNVSMGRPDVTSEAVRAALNDVGLLEEARDLPDGLGTQLSTTAAPLSTGQGRRLMIARALAGRPRMLILDDVLDDLDASALKQVSKAVLAPDAPWSAVIFTLDPAIAKRCDRVIQIPGAQISKANSVTSIPMESAEPNSGD